MIGSLLAQVTSLKDAGSAAGQTQDSLIIGEQFYFFTVVIMWLIHAGFMSYETGVARKKNALMTAMKNILTIAVVTPTFYYFGWWIYNCNQPGLPIGPNSSDFTGAACQGGIPWSDTFGPNLTNNINLVFFLAFLLFSWTTASILSGAMIERARGRLSEADRSAVESITAQIVNKLLHLPTVRLKEAAAGADGVDYADAVRYLFGLDD